MTSKHVATKLRRAQMNFSVAAFLFTISFIFPVLLLLPNAESSAYFVSSAQRSHLLHGKTPSITTLSATFQETDRQKEYIKRNYTWPIAAYTPNTPGWKALHERRFNQLSRIEDIGQKYNGWLSAISSAVVISNFTTYGFGLTRAPNHLVKELRHSLHSALRENRTRLEQPIEIIETRGENEEESLRPLFVDQPDLNAKICRELEPLHSSWASTPLEDGITYGLRVYRNNSSLLMHVDRPETRIIASILHVDHSEDSEPWPIVIEDFNGNTHEIIMESGDMLLYESSKCLHGRPKVFNGSWYSSVFSHYYPEGWDTVNFHMEPHYAVPPHWFELEKSDKKSSCEELEVVGVGLKEVGCDDGWSALRDSIKWHGPAKEGVIWANGDLTSVEDY